MKKMSNITAIIVICLILSVVMSSFTGCANLPFFGSNDNPEDLTFSVAERHTRKDVLIAENGERQTVYSTQEIPPTKPGTPSADDVPENNKDEENNIEPLETRLRFLAAGDNIMHSNMIDDANERAGGNGYNFRDMYEHIEAEVKAADIAFINVETPIAGDEFPYTGYPNFNTPKENGIALVDVGFDIINIANNHMLDKKEQGYINNINFWESQDVLLVGGFKDEADFETVRVYNRDEVSIAFLSYTYGTNGMFLPSDSKMIIPWIDAEIIERQIKAARTQADLLFVVMHWGIEDSFTPNAEQTNLAQMMVNNGVDVILGMHPHVLQETKWVDKPDGGQTLIAYSIGNFISAMLYGRNMIGAMLGFDIVKLTDKTGESKVWVENAEMIPIMTHFNKSRKGLQVYKFEDYTKELAEQHWCAGNDPVFSYGYIMNTIKENILPQFLSDFYAE